MWWLRGLGGSDGDGVDHNRHMLTNSGFPLALTASIEGVWREADGSLSATALPESDLFIAPVAPESGESGSMLNAATLLGHPPAGDFQLSARVDVDFNAQFDAGVLLIWVDDRHWAKLCFEYSPDSEPIVVSVVTRELSDDANSFVVQGNSVWLRVSRLGRAYAFHASTDGQRWQLVRVFTLGESTREHRVGFEVQAPTGQGCDVRFSDISFTQSTLTDLRDGS